MKKCLVVLFKGFEEIEAIASVDILRRAGIAVTTAAFGGKPLIVGAHDIGVVADGIIEDCDENDFDAILIPGGSGVFSLRKDEKLLRLVMSFSRDRKLIAAICAAPILLEDARLLKGRKYTAHPCIDGKLSEPAQKNPVVEDGNLITANGPGAAIDFALAVASYLCGESVSVGI
ncbi:MAG: DJ-1/PfpI family protein [Puniceicoccales bacterium]|jgi:4-methyl-5(b-hydroxyethyl)-thiazole monophosphate biosynthesis|nr:DJ-1/PfpI family protein [Puniceicoccales bacterium]